MNSIRTGTLSGGQSPAAVAEAACRLNRLTSFMAPAPPQPRSNCFRWTTPFVNVIDTDSRYPGPGQGQGRQAGLDRTRDPCPTVRLWLIVARCVWSAGLPG